MGWQKIPPTKRQIQKVSYCKARLGSFMDLNKPKYLKEDRKFRPDRPSLGGRVQILRQKTENYAQVLSFRAYSQWIQRQINVLTRYEKNQPTKKKKKKKKNPQKKKKKKKKKK